jgi:hypothetical protein
MCVEMSSCVTPLHAWEMWWGKTCHVMRQDRWALVWHHYMHVIISSCHVIALDLWDMSFGVDVWEMSIGVRCMRDVHHVYHVRDVIRYHYIHVHMWCLHHVMLCVYHTWSITSDTTTSMYICEHTHDILCHRLKQKQDMSCRDEARHQRTRHLLKQKHDMPCDEARHVMSSLVTTTSCVMSW